MSEKPTDPKDEMTEAPQLKKGAENTSGGHQKTSGMAVAGLVLGLIALLSCWIPFLNVVTTPFAILGLVFAVIGIVATAPAKPKGGRGIAIAAAVLSIISLVIPLAMYGGAAASVSNDTNNQSDKTEITAPAQEDDADASNDGDDTASDTTANEGIVVKSCKAGRDYAGEKTAVVTIEWTNETGETSQFFTTYNDTAYVKGEEVDRTFGSGEGWYNDQKKVKSGKTQTIKLMYDWDGKSDIEFEITDFFGGDPIISKTLRVK